MEQKEVIDDKLLDKIAQLLKVPADAIRNFDVQAAINIISNTFTHFKDNSVANANYCTFNSIDKIVELYDEVIKVEGEKIALLERMLEKK